LSSQALIRSAAYSHNQQHRDLGSVYEHTIGVIFLGTPHRGSIQASIGRIISNIIQITGKSSNDKLLETLETDSVVLEEQRGNFTTISNKMYIVCAYEEIPVPVIGLIVPERSAVYEGFNIQKIGVPADHLNMCKFSHRREVGYGRIYDKIMACLNDAHILYPSGSPDTQDQSPQDSQSVEVMIRKGTPDLQSRVIVKGLSGEINPIEPNIPSVQIGLLGTDTTIFIREEGSKVLLQFANELIRKVNEKASQPNTKPNIAALARFQSAVEDVRKYIGETSKQHRVLQFFTEGEIRQQLDKLHTKLGASYASLANEPYDKLYDERAKNAKEEDRTMDYYLEGIGGDVTKIVGILGCGEPPKDVMSALRMRRDEPDEVGPAFSLLQDYIQWAKRDWAWLTFTESKQDMKAPLTRVVKQIISDMEDDLPSDDTTALTSGDLTLFAMVERLYAVLDNSSKFNLALVRSFRSALAKTDLRDKLRKVNF